jgi:hypothetical protein
MTFYASIGKKPIRLRKAVAGHVGNGFKRRSTERSSISSSKASSVWRMQTSPCAMGRGFGAV